MSKLLEQEKFWKSYWDFEGNSNIAMPVNYHDYILWEVIYKKYMPKVKGAKILEIGSAPGNHLVRLSQVFGLIPYGVESSKQGAELNRRLFCSNNINPDNVIYADFFSDEFQERYKECFNIVISRGFIEDFSCAEAEGIIKKHVNLLTKGGHLFVSIPNMSGIYYLWMRLFERSLLSEFNLNIMKKRQFAKLFDNKGLLGLFCGYYGTFNCGHRFSTKRNSSMRFVFNFFDYLQGILDVFLRIMFKEKGLENRLFSPYILFIGVKNE